LVIELRLMSEDVASALLAGERPSDVVVADDYPTEFTLGMAPMAGAGSPLGPWLIHRQKDGLVVGDIGGAYTGPGQCEIGYAIVPSCWGQGLATEAVKALVIHARSNPDINVLVGHTPLDRPASARVLSRAGFQLIGEVDDEHDGETIRVQRWELSV
jgi:[ribosomal protein S5]-alanine N-acetyltransferase